MCCESGTSSPQVYLFKIIYSNLVLDFCVISDGAISNQKAVHKQLFWKPDTEDGYELVPIFSSAVFTHPRTSTKKMVSSSKFSYHECFILPEWKKFSFILRTFYAAKCSFIFFFPSPPSLRKFFFFKYCFCIIIRYILLFCSIFLYSFWSYFTYFFIFLFNYYWLQFFLSFLHV